MDVIWIRALFRSVVIAVALWVGQSLVKPINHIGIWAMVSLGIASALFGVVLIKTLFHHANRSGEAFVQFIASGVILEVFYLVVPKAPRMAAGDFTLAVLVALVSGFAEWLAPERLQGPQRVR